MWVAAHSEKRRREGAAEHAASRLGEARRLNKHSLVQREVAKANTEVLHKVVSKCLRQDKKEHIESKIEQAEKADKDHDINKVHMLVKSLKKHVPKPYQC